MVKDYQHLYYIKTKRTFTPIKRFSWALVPVIALGGLFWPKIGLLMIPIMLTIILLSLFRGKYWCGNVCPHGSLFDNLLLPWTRSGTIPAILKAKWLQIGFFAFFMAMFALRILRVAGSWGTLSFYDKLGFVLALNYLIPTILGVILALGVSSRAWCSICPMGMMQQIVYKVGTLTRLNQRTDHKLSLTQAAKCHKCAKCARVCPMQLTPYREADDQGILHADACIRCGTCVAHCPAGVLSIQPVQRLKSISIQPPLQRTRFSAELVAKTAIAPDTYEFTFHSPQLRTTAYRPGQFILVQLLPESEMFRAYSVSGYDAPLGQLQITVKLLADGLGSEIIRREFTVGQSYILEGPMGDELIVDSQAKRLLLVAGGIGITPFLPIVEDLLQNGSSSEITLVQGAAQPEELYYHQHFAALAASHPNLTYLPVAENSTPHWTGARGTVIDVLEDVPLPDSTVYICGSAGMVRALNRHLSARGVNPEQIFAESA